MGRLSAIKVQLELESILTYVYDFNVRELALDAYNTSYSKCLLDHLKFYSFILCYLTSCVYN